MAPRIARAVLALLCVVSVIYGTALFPAAFDVQLRTENPVTSSAGPATSVGPSGTGPVQSPNDGVDSTDSGDTGDQTATSTATPTPDRESTPVPPSQDQHADTGDDGLDGLFATVSAALLLGFLGASVLGLLVLFRDVDGNLPFGLPAVPVPAFVPRLSLQRIPQLTTWLLVGAAGGFARVVDDVTTLGRVLAGSVAAGFGPALRLAGRSLAALPRATATLVVAPVRALATSLALLGGLSVLRGGISRPRLFRSETPTTDARSESDVAPATDDGTDRATSVLDAWRAMTDLVPVRNPETTTPAEYARKAVAVGLPEGPVERLTDLFREVRYGGHRDTTDRVATARRALDDLTGGEE